MGNRIPPVGLQPQQGVHNPPANVPAMLNAQRLGVAGNTHSTMTPPPSDNRCCITRFFSNVTKKIGEVFERIKNFIFCTKPQTTPPNTPQVQGNTTQSSPAHNNANPLQVLQQEQQELAVAVQEGHRLQHVEQQQIQREQQLQGQLQAAQQQQVQLQQQLQQLPEPQPQELPLQAQEENQPAVQFQNVLAQLLQARQPLQPIQQQEPPHVLAPQLQPVPQLAELQQELQAPQVDELVVQNFRNVVAEFIQHPVQQAEQQQAPQDLPDAVPQNDHGHDAAQQQAEHPRLQQELQNAIRQQGWQLRPIDQQQADQPQLREKLLNAIRQQGWQLRHFEQQQAKQPQLPEELLNAIRQQVWQLRHIEQQQADQPQLREKLLNAIRQQVWQLHHIEQQPHHPIDNEFNADDLLGLPAGVKIEIPDHADGESTPLWPKDRVQQQSPFKQEQPLATPGHKRSQSDSGKSMITGQEKAELAILPTPEGEATPPPVSTSPSYDLKQILPNREKLTPSRRYSFSHGQQSPLPSGTAKPTVSTFLDYLRRSFVSQEKKEGNNSFPKASVSKEKRGWNQNLAGVFNSSKSGTSKS